MTPQALISPARLVGGALLCTQSDERLVDLVRAGNDGAFEVIVARYRRPLLRYCSALLPQARAEDAVQQSFLHAYESLRASDRDMRLRPWLYRIVHNAALNALRDRELCHEELSEGIDGVERPDQAFERRQGLRDVVAAVRALPERQRNAIVLRELEGRSYGEIAAQLGVGDGAVRQLLGRARTTLRAGSSAIAPAGLFMRLPWQSRGGNLAERISELCGAGTGGALMAKLCATTLVTGAVVGGVAGVPIGGDQDGRARAASGPAADMADARTRGDGDERILTGERRGRPGTHNGSRPGSGRDGGPGRGGGSRRSAGPNGDSGSDLDGEGPDPTGKSRGDSGGDSGTEDNERSDGPGGRSGSDDEGGSEPGGNDNPAGPGSGDSGSSTAVSLGSAAAENDAPGSDAGASGDSSHDAASVGGSAEPTD